MTATFAYGYFFALSIAAMLSAPWAFALLLLMYPLEQLLQASGGPFLTFPWLGNVITATCVGIAVLRVYIKRPWIINGYANSQWVISVVLILWSLTSLAWSPSRESAWQIINSWYPFIVLNILVGSLLVFDLDTLRRACVSLLISGVILALVISTSSDFRNESGRLVAGLGGSQVTNPLVLGEFGGSLLICSLLIGNRGVVFAILRAVGFLLGSAITLQSGSRGQLLFAIVLSVLFFPVARKINSFRNFIASAALFLLATVVFAYIAPMFLQGYGLSRWETGVVEDSLMGRMQNSLDLVRALMVNPLAWIFGLGYNAFSTIGQAKNEVYAHNVSIEVLAELGIPMFVLYVTMLWRACRDGRQLIRDHADYPEIRSAIGILLAVTCYQFMLAQKQGTLWACGGLLMLIITINRLQRRNALDTEVLPNSGT